MVLVDDEYIFKSEVAPHFSSVKTVRVVDENTVLTGSSDGFALMLRRDGFQTPFREACRYIIDPPSSSATAGCSYNTKKLKPVYDVTFASPLSENSDSLYNKGFVATANANGCIYVYHPSASEPLDIIETHTAPVCVVKSPVMKGERYLISGSWDACAMIWKDGHAVSVLSHHTGSVLDICTYIDPKSRKTILVTASADASMVAWELCFAEARLDLPTSSQRLIGATPASVLNQGHTGPIRSVAYLPNLNLLASTGNDMRICLWDASTYQLLHTKENAHESFIYSLKYIIPNEEVAVETTSTLATVGEDSCLCIWRVTFSRETSRASITLHQRMLLHAGTSLWQLAGCKLTGEIHIACSDSKLKTFIQRSSLSKQSQISEEERNIVLKNSEAFALKAQETHRHFQMQLEEESRPKKKKLNGREYDYVFDVDIVEGAPTLKLPFNLSENPFTVAEQFVRAHNLDASFVEQTAQFIIKNTNYQSISQSGSSSTTEILYTANTKSAGQISTPSPMAFRQNQSYIRFENKNTANIFKKISEFSDQLKAAGDASLCISDQQLVASFSAPYSASTQRTFYEGLLTRLLMWPDHLIFPAFDLMRILVLDRDFTAYFTENMACVLDRIFAVLQSRSVPGTSQNIKNTRAAGITASRLLANMVHQNIMQHNALCSLLTRLPLVPRPDDPSIILALVTAVLNVSILLVNLERTETIEQYKELLFAVLSRYVTLGDLDTKGWLSHFGDQLTAGESSSQYEEAIYRSLVSIQNYLNLHTASCACDLSSSTQTPPCGESLALMHSLPAYAETLSSIEHSPLASKKHKSLSTLLLEYAK